MYALRAHAARVMYTIRPARHICAVLPLPVRRVTHAPGSTPVPPSSFYNPPTSRRWTPACVSCSPGFVHDSATCCLLLVRGVLSFMAFVIRSSKPTSSAGQSMLRGQPAKNLLEAVFSQLARRALRFTAVSHRISIAITLAAMDRWLQLACGDMPELGERAQLPLGALPARVTLTLSNKPHASHRQRHRLPAAPTPAITSL